MINVGEFIKSLREEKELGVNQLSRLSGVQASYISALEQGNKKNPSIGILTKITKALSFSEAATAKIILSIADETSTYHALREELFKMNGYYPMDENKSLEVERLCLNRISSYLLQNGGRLNPDDLIFIADSFEMTVKYLVNKNIAQKINSEKE